MSKSVIQKMKFLLLFNKGLVSADLSYRLKNEL